ncbi:MAG: cellulase N-terminal Ig-like domain-containing protein, partial [Candidatus Omnitrophota bacterium]|nr:cellulase N-terminal Ig-like domain-containing protein [Candidatus Omnitrophota bacterium]
MKKILFSGIIITLIFIFFLKGFLPGLFSQKRPTLSEFSDLIAVSQIGFKPQDEKSAVLGMNVRPESKKFSIVDSQGNKVYEADGHNAKTKFRGNTLLFV